MLFPEECTKRGVKHVVSLCLLAMVHEKLVHLLNLCVGATRTEDCPLANFWCLGHTGRKGRYSLKIKERLAAKYIQGLHGNLVLSGFLSVPRISAPFLNCEVLLRLQGGVLLCFHAEMLKQSTGLWTLLHIRPSWMRRGVVDPSACYCWGGVPQ